MRPILCAGPDLAQPSGGKTGVSLMYIKFAPWRRINLAVLALPTTSDPLPPAMSILGAVLRTHPQHLPAVLTRLGALPGVDVALNPGDGRLVLVMEDTADPEGQTFTAAAMLADMAMWPDVLSTSLVYEYSGPDAPALGEGDMSDYRRWRGKPGNRAAGAAAAADATTDFLANPVPHGTDRELFP